jgi:hypothetical protein
LNFDVDVTNLLSTNMSLFKNCKLEILCKTWRCNHASYSILFCTKTDSLLRLSVITTRFKPTFFSLPAQLQSWKVALSVLLVASYSIYSQIYLVHIRALMSLYQIIVDKCTHILLNHVYHISLAGLASVKYNNIRAFVGIYLIHSQSLSLSEGRLHHESEDTRGTRDMKWNKLEVNVWMGG